MILIGTGCRHLTRGSISKRQQYMEWPEDVSSKKLSTTPLMYSTLANKHLNEKHYEIFADDLIKALLFLSYFMGDIPQSFNS
uniref:Uncharacterized protein n=1 Tax=Lactuca sativa TaxID=4236 RepID=A0A9R1WM56_LACSA|nr:hypothetical protein LSAT_V11C100009560 [Lactuca sativa]